MWDAIHVVSCNMKDAPKVSYKVISTVMVTVEADGGDIGKMDIAGSSSKGITENHTMPENDASLDPDMFHIATIGKMIESNEDALRNNV